MHKPHWEQKARLGQAYSNQGSGALACLVPAVVLHFLLTRVGGFLKKEKSRASIL